MFRGTHAGTGAFHGRQYAASFVTKGLASRGEPQAALLAMDQRNLQVGFQFPNRSGQRGSFNMHSGRGAGKTLFFGDGQEIT
jgi:hypothetical protein